MAAAIVAGELIPGEEVYGFGLCECGCGEKTRVAERNRHNEGMVKGEPIRFLNGHQLRGARGEPTMGYVIEDRGHETPCFIWLGNKAGNGYGTFGEGSGSTYRKVYAHRRAYEASKGAVPEDLQIDHLCRVHDCVNPEHLEAVTSAENTRRGHVARSSAIAPEAVAELRRLVAAGECSTKIAAERVGISRSYAYRILAEEARLWTA